MRRKIMCLTKISQKAEDDEFARSVRVRDAARRAVIAVDTDQRASQGRSPLHLALIG